MRKLCIFVLLAFFLTACGKSSPAAVTTEPEQEVTSGISETTAPLQTDGSDNRIPWNDPSSIGGSTWQEAYLSVIKCDRQQLLADPDNLRYPEDTYVYLGIHDFEGDGTPELIFGDGVSLAVFTYAEGRVERIADLYFPGNIWCVNGIAIHGNGMSVMCAGSGGMDCVNFGYIDGGMFWACTLRERIWNRPSMEKFVRLMTSTEFTPRITMRWHRRSSGRRFNCYLKMGNGY